MLRIVERARQVNWADKEVKELEGRLREHFPDWSPVGIIRIVSDVILIIQKGQRVTADDYRKQDEYRRNEHISHYILLLAYCRT